MERHNSSNANHCPYAHTDHVCADDCRSYGCPYDPDPVELHVCDDTCRQQEVKPMITEYISAADTAKMLRQALKERFPGVKFGVRTSVYSGGASIHVKWYDGPEVNAVDAVAQQFKGATFDPMTDTKHLHTTRLPDGREVRFGAHYIFCNRYSAADDLRRANTAFTNALKNRA